MGFIHLCGVPSIDFKHLVFRSKKDFFWNQLVTAYNKKHIVVSGTSDESLKVEQLMKTGLRANHCYTMLSVHKAKIHNKEQRVVKLRNPWGHDSWNGAHLFESAECVS